MNEKICCGFGHRDYYGGTDSLSAALEYAVSKNAPSFKQAEGARLTERFPRRS